MKNDTYKLYSSLPIYSRHKTWAEIDLDALRHNYRLLGSRVRGEKTPRIICVMKADAYGHGADSCTRALLEEGCDFFAVSCIEEAVALRKVCIELGKYADILILGYTLPYSAGELSANNIIQTVFSPEYARALGDEAKRQRCHVRVHVKLDTGMNRIGFVAQSKESIEKSACDIAEVCRDGALIVEGMFTHFAKADETDDSMTRLQFERFTAVKNALCEKGIKIPFFHVSNSASSVRYPEFALDGVREGILLYGARASEVADLDGLRPVMSLKSVISHIHTLKPGETVSYGGKYSSGEEKTLATIPIGYADGFIRAYSGASVSVATKNGNIEAPIVGRICMDQCMIDITGTDAGVGDVVTLFGDDPGRLYRLAELAGTIDYECLCLISGRVPRIYK